MSTEEKRPDDATPQDAPNEDFASMMQRMMENCPCGDAMKQMMAQKEEGCGCGEMMAQMMNAQEEGGCATMMTACKEMMAGGGASCPTTEDATD